MTSIPGFIDHDAAPGPVTGDRIGTRVPQAGDASDISPQMVRVFRSHDGRLTLVCHYDDKTGELGYCDIM